MATIVNLQEVTKDYGQGQALTHALRGVNLVIEAGEFTAMAGPSGSGKSTLLNIMGGLDRPTSGRVEVDGREISDLSNTELGLLRRDRLGFIFQSYNLIPVLTALENAEYVLMLQGIPTHERRAAGEGSARGGGTGGVGESLPTATEWRPTATGGHCPGHSFGTGTGAGR